MSKHEDIVIKILSDMAGIGGVPTNEEFYTEFNGRLKEELGISDSRQLSAVPSEERIREMSKEFVEVIEVYLDATDRGEVLRRAENLINAVVRELK